MSLHYVLYLVAFVLFVLAACNVPSRVNLAAAALALLTLTLLV